MNNLDRLRDAGTSPLRPDQIPDTMAARRVAQRVEVAVREFNERALGSEWLPHEILTYNEDGSRTTEGLAFAAQLHNELRAAGWDVKRSFVWSKEKGEVDGLEFIVHSLVVQHPPPSQRWWYAHPSIGPLLYFIIVALSLILIRMAWGEVQDAPDDVAVAEVSDE